MMTINEPVQLRSKKTFEAILAATEALLDSKSFAAISVAEIVARAGCSTGSFYARFDSKEALLPALYDRYDSAVPNLIDKIHAERSTRPVPMEQLLDEILSSVALGYTQQPNLMRAIILYARTEPDSISADTRAQRKELSAKITSLFEPFAEQIRHPNLPEAVLTALFMAIAAMRDRLLFPDAPNASTFTANQESFIGETVFMASAYLRAERGSRP
jgi:AcrR family transcriptional regulator